jgi:para-aminobenzoate synthetase component 1
MMDGDDLGLMSAAQVLSFLRSLFPRRDDPTQAARVPFSGGLVGFAGYAFGLMLEGIRSRHAGQADVPDMAVALYEYAYAWDRQEKRCYVSGFSQDRHEESQCAAAWYALPLQAEPVPFCPSFTLEPDQSEASYCQAVAQARELIAAGDIFQVNITGRYTAFLPDGVSRVDLYRRLRADAPAPFGAYLSCGADFSLLSCSPERFLSVSDKGAVTSRPIKGTAPRGLDAAQDEALARHLAEDEKECAENLMIVDLMRHDIGRVARIGSMQVQDFLKVERFAHVHHLVSEVRGTLRSESDAFDLLAATLPPGSVTGAPKHRALEIIDALEASARGAYCGTVFRIGVDGSMDSAVIIRSFECAGQVMRIGVGGGITILSDPQKEYEEMRLKLAPFAAFAEGA